VAFTDPLSITISGTTSTLPRTFLRDDETTYSSSDGLIQVSAAHDSGRRNRHVLRVNHSKVSADPFKPAENVKNSMSHYMVFDLPPVGYTATEILAIYTGFKTLYTAGTDAIITKLLGGES
jgi:hypothetical protein